MTKPETNVPVRAISDLVVQPEFPQSAVGQTVDIGGYIGLIVGVVKHSIKVRSAEGATMSYNINTLRKLYGPPVPLQTDEITPTGDPLPDPASAVKRNVITHPNFDAPVKPIEGLVEHPDFPACVLGEFIDLHGYSGVVVEIIERSLKIRSREGATRRYNADGLRKLYGRPAGASSPQRRI
jgi:hypothetical protein